MRSVTSNEAKARFGSLLDDAREAPVLITKHGRVVAVMVSADEYTVLADAKRARLRAEIDVGISELGRGEGTPYDSARLAALGAAVKLSGRAKLPA